MNKLPEQSTKISLPIKLALAATAGLLAWAVGPFGLLDKDVVSEIPAWILPGIFFGALVLLPHGSLVSSGRVVSALGIGVLAWISAFAVGGVCSVTVGFVSLLPVETSEMIFRIPLLIAGMISGAILGFLVPFLTQSRKYFWQLGILSFAGFIGSIPFAYCFTSIPDLDESLVPQRIIPSYIFWNMIIAVALDVLATRNASKLAEIS
jgi:hypothetical protein